MRRIGNSSALRAISLRAILLAWGLALICLPTHLIAAPLISPGSVDRDVRSDEPFGLSTAAVTKGAVLEKWLNVEREVDDERLVLRMCEENRASCQSRAALQLLAIVDSGRTLEGRARLGEINRAINLKLKPMSDLALYGAEDVWSPPLATLAIGAGDCEDYAISQSSLPCKRQGFPLMTFALSSCGTTSGKKITPLSRHGSTGIGSRWTIATWPWSRTMTCGVTALYFWSIVTASSSTPMRPPLPRHRADMSEP